MWEYLPKQDLLIYGIINSKERMKNNALIAFNVKVLSFNKKYVRYFVDELKKGNNIDVNLRFAKIIL